MSTNAAKRPSTPLPQNKRAALRANRTTPSDQKTAPNLSPQRQQPRRKQWRRHQSTVAAPQILIFNKPFNVLTQFSGTEQEITLAHYIDVKDVYAAGRLDKDSEGLLVLTDDGKLQARLTQPQAKAPKTYWVQVEGIPSESALEALRRGIALKDGVTRPARVERIAEPDVWPRTPPVRQRANIPTTWLSLTIYEGRNRQVRRMTAHVGYPTLRLIRYQLGPWTVQGLAPGEWRHVTLSDGSSPTDLR